jgi:hypothetical protein
MHDATPGFTRLRFRMVNALTPSLRGKGRAKWDYTHKACHRCNMEQTTRTEPHLSLHLLISSYLEAVV